jgi:uncharacterized protein
VCDTKIAVNNPIGIIFILVSVAVSFILERKLAAYAKAKLRANLSGAEVADRMLHDYGIGHVKIICIRGYLTDHYNPLAQTVNLSTQVYYGRDVASAAIAVHECGHAVQHVQGYVFLRFYFTMVPVLTVTAYSMPWIIWLGILLAHITLIPLAVGLALFTLITLFSWVILPIEFDASRRALIWLDNARVVTSQERQMAKNALRWAAMTYVVAALGSLAKLLRLLYILRGRQRSS